MQPETAATLLDLNRGFYQTFAQSFAATRRRVQPGVLRALAGVPAAGRWLDLGCGSGALAAVWAAGGRSGLYHGLDFSPGLLDAARAEVAEIDHPGLDLRFDLADLGAPGWNAVLDPQSYDGALAFAVLHHLPSHALRLGVLRRMAAALAPGGRFLHSEWQYQHSPRLLARQLPWQMVGLEPEQLEPGDTLLDWRAPQSGQKDTGLRYVHLFTRDELDTLAAESGFRVLETYVSDGEGGRLGLYQVWERI